MERSAIRNGKIVKESEAVLPVTYREVQYSFSVYEALRVLKGHVVHLEDHLRRLAFSCGAIHLFHPFDDKNLHGALTNLSRGDNAAPGLFQKKRWVHGQNNCFFCQSIVI